VESWDQNYPDLKNTIDRKNAVMNVFGVIIIMIAGIGILNLLLMAVYERTREIGLLGAMGLKPRQIATLFILEGTMIGLVGAAAGVVIGLLLNGSLGIVGVDYSQFSSLSDYMALVTTRVYPTLGLNNLVARALTVIIISTLAAWIPANEAARREPAEALHYV
jgi:ABC-type lipoprotein release transport system permease subunit